MIAKDSRAGSRCWVALKPPPHSAGHKRTGVKMVDVVCAYNFLGDFKCEQEETDFASDCTLECY